MRGFLSLLFILFLSDAGFAQKEDYTWYFGATGAGLNFDSCRITVLTDANMSPSTFEGTVAISDEQTGQLLFYSNGLNIYSANHTVMQNGFQAALSTSITQNIIIKKPGSNTLFYLFTADVQGGITSNPSYPNAIGINYAEIDMSLNGGQGSVISKFNILKDTSNSEKLTAVRHANGQDIWLIGHEYGNNRFFVYKITSAGIDTIPQFYALGPEINTWQPGIPASSRYDAIGEMKASPDGTKLAFTTYYNGYSAVFSFDKSTGIISNPIALNISGSGYGLTFSPDNNLLYIGRMDTISTGGLPATAQLLQFDLRSGDSATIQQSKFILYTCNDCGFSSMKIAPNRKIIVSHYGFTGGFTGDAFLGVIHQPDSLGNSANYAHVGITLQGHTSSWGLNNLMENPYYCVTTGIEETPGQPQAWQLQANPFSEELVLSGGDFRSATIRIYSAIGQLIKEIILPEDQQGEVRIQDLKNTVAGMYLIDIRNTQQRKVIKAIKQ